MDGRGVSGSEEVRVSDILCNLRRLRAANALTEAGRFGAIFCVARESESRKGANERNIQTTDLLECEPIRRGRGCTGLVFEPHYVCFGEYSLRAVRCQLVHGEVQGVTKAEPQMELDEGEGEKS